MKVLVSAFKPFNNQTKNHSMEVLNYIKDVDKIVIDVVYDKCYETLSTKFDLSSYDLIIALGEARSRNVLTLETNAYNIASCSLADNKGVIKNNQSIIKDGKEVIVSKVNLTDIDKLVTLSTYPGKFVCNNLYYYLLTYHQDRSIFIHIPETDKYEQMALIINEIIDKIDENNRKSLSN